MSNKKVPIIVGAAITLLVLLLLYLNGQGKDTYSWREHYNPESKDPYGIYLVRNLLESYYPGEQFKVLEDSIGSQLDSGNFVYVGNQFWLDSASLDQLLHFVENGNHAFIACTYLPNNLMDSLNLQECEVFKYYASTEPDGTTYLDHFSGTAVSANFKHPALQDASDYNIGYAFLNSPEPYEWGYLVDDLLCDSQTVFASLGTLNNGRYINFVSAQYGNGTFYLHTTPLAFTNIHLLEQRGLEYAAKSFSHLKKGTIYWDERAFNPSQGQGNCNAGRKENPLRYVLSQPPLAWAWYVLLGMAVLYLIFRAKRRQRVIPIVEKNANTSLEFVGTIGRLFFMQNNHRQLASQKMRLFLVFVRERYHVPTKDLGEHFVKGLALRSNLPEEHIQKIVNLNQNISNSSFLSESTLIDFHRLLERFYRECR